MRNAFGRRAGRIGLGVILFLGVSGGIAYATIPDGAGVIHACYQVDKNGDINGDGKIRLIDPGSANQNTKSCKKDEKALDWNAQGQGATGAQGPKGDTGATGP